MPVTPIAGQDFDARMVTVLAQGNAEPSDILALVSAWLQEQCGVRLVTMTQRETTDGSFLRLYSSMPDAYAASGRKPPNQTPWSAQVIDRHETFVANDYSGIAATMADHEQIRALGCESILNIPIVLRNQVVGTLNCLAGPGHFDERTIAACETMRLPVAMALLLHKQTS